MALLSGTRDLQAMVVVAYQSTPVGSLVRYLSRHFRVTGQKALFASWCIMLVPYTDMPTCRP